MISILLSGIIIEISIQLQFYFIINNFKLKFFVLFYRGVVRIDVRLEDVDINQCPMAYHVANAFKNSDRCDYTSTLVIYYTFKLLNSLVLLN